MGDTGREDTPRTTGEDILSTLLTGGILGRTPINSGLDPLQLEQLNALFAEKGRNLGGLIESQLSTSQFGGPLSAGLTQNQRASSALAPFSVNSLNRLFPQGERAISGLAGLGAGGGTSPTDLNAILGGAVGQQDLSNLARGLAFTPGSSALGDLARGAGPGSAGLNSFFTTRFGGPQTSLMQLAAERPDISSLSNFLNVDTPERSALNAFDFTAPEGGAAELLKGLAGSGGSDFASLFGAIADQSEVARGRATRDLREQFSSQGLRFGTDLANAQVQQNAEFQTNLLAELSRLGLSAAGPQSQNRVQAATALGGVEQQGIAQQLAAIQAAGGLGIQGAQLGLGAAQTQAQANVGTRGQTGDILSTAGQLGLGQTGQALTAAQTLGSLGLGAAQSQQAGATQAAGALGQLGLGQQQARAGLFDAAGNRQLSALQSLPGAIEQTTGLPLGISQGLFGLGEAERQVGDTDIVRQISEFQRTQGSLFQPLLSFFSNTPQIVTPGIGDTLAGLAPTAAATAVGIQGAK